MSKIKNPQDVMLASKGYLRVSEAAKKIGRDVGYVHRQLRRGVFSEKEGSALRIASLWYIYEPALAVMLGSKVAELMGVRSTGFPPPFVNKPIRAKT